MMLRNVMSPLLLPALALALAPRPGWSQTGDLNTWKAELASAVDARADLTQEIVDRIFSFAELGFQEFETSAYLVELLRENGFEVQEGVAGIPTAWVASWGSGSPVVSLGTDIDDIPQASQTPGVACALPLVDGAPGHGEGHNAGQAVNITAALAVKELMEREGLRGTIRIWPGVAEEQLGTKAHYVRAGMFDDVDLVLYAHVGSNMGTSWGITPGTGLISAEFHFEGQSAHAGGAPWRGRSAADAVTLMEVGWNFRREHIRPQARSHSVIVNGGDQPNVVPPRASIWYYFRERNQFSHAKGMRMLYGNTGDP
jgi:aminobenzoyl-glutamate utilization protein B